MFGATLRREPFRALIGNLAWTHEGSAWGLWRVDPVPYRYAASEDKLSYSRITGTLLRALRGEPLLLSIAGPVSAGYTVRRAASGIDLSRHPLYAEIAESYEYLLSNVDVRERTYWLALPLPHRDSSSAAGGVLASATTDFARSFGFTPRLPGLAEVEAKAAQAAKVTRAITGLVPATPDDWLWIHQRAARRGTFAEPAASDPPPWRAAAQWRGGKLRAPSYAALGEIHFDEGGRAVRDEEARERGRLGRRGPGASNPFSHRFVRVTTPDGGVSYQAFLVLCDIPQMWAFPGGEWLAGLHEGAPFPIDWAIRAKVTPGSEAKVRIGRKRKQLAEQVGQYTPGNNEPAHMAGDLPEWVMAGQRQLADESANLDANSAEVEYEATIVIGVWGGTREECEERAEAIRLTLSEELVAVRPTGDQIGCYTAMLPGVAAPRVVNDYKQFLLAEDLSRTMPFAGGRLGDGTGQVLGLTLDAGIPEPVQLNIADWTRRDISASLGLFAELGAGKSVTLKKILADVGAGGARTIGWDRTRPREQVTFLQAAFGADSVQVVDLAAPTGFSLDPLRVLPRNEAETAAETLVSQLLGIDATSERGTVLAEALEAVCSRPYPSMNALIEQLDGLGDGDPVALGLGRQLKAVARRPVSAVVFDPRLTPLSLSAPHIIFATHGMALPKRHEMRSDAMMMKLPFDALFGRAVLTLTARVAKTIAFGDPRFCLVHADECYWLTREGEGSPGYDTVLELIRDGRKNHAGILLAGHDPEDTGDPTLLGLLSAIFVGRQRNASLAHRYVQALGVHDPDMTEQLVAVITENLSPLTFTDRSTGDPMVQPGREGEFLARIHNRIGRIKVLIPPVERIQRAIRTTPLRDEVMA